MKNSSIVKSIIKGVIVPILTLAMILPSSVNVFAGVGDSGNRFYGLGEMETLGEKNIPPAWNQPSQANPHSSNWNNDGANLLYPDMHSGRDATASAAVTSDGVVLVG